MKRYMLAIAILCCCSVASAAEPLFEITIRINWPTRKVAPVMADKPRGYKDPLVRAIEENIEQHERAYSRPATSYHGYPIETDSKGFKFFIDKDGKCGARGNRVYVDGSDWVGGSS